MIKQIAILKCALRLAIDSKICLHFVFVRFSVNFTLDACPSSRNIAYHFKTDFRSNQVVHNYKTVDYWNEEIVEENTWIQGAGKVYALDSVIL